MKLGIRLTRAFRFLKIVIMPNHSSSGFFRLIYRAIVSKFGVLLLVTFISYCIAWLIIAKSVENKVYRIINSGMTMSDTFYSVSSFDGLSFNGFPFHIDINIDSLEIRTDFVSKITLKNLELRYPVFSTNRLKIKEIGELFIQISQDGEQYIANFNQTPILKVDYDNTGILERIMYRDMGYRILNATTGEIIDNINENSFDYEFVHAKDKSAYNIDFSTKMQLSNMNCKNCNLLNAVKEMRFDISISGEKISEDYVITINSFLLRSPIFKISGFGSILPKNDQYMFRINTEITPYKVFLDFIANYFLDKGSFSLSKTDIGRYYSAIYKNIIPRLTKEDNQGDETLKTMISKDREGDVFIGDLSLDHLFSILASARYNIIYENLATNQD